MIPGFVTALVFAFALIPPAVAAQDTLEAVPGFVLWPASRLQTAADQLEKTIGDKSLVFETIGNYQGHSVYLVLRGSTGQAEVHETEADV